MLPVGVLGVLVDHGAAVPGAALGKCGTHAGVTPAPQLGVGTQGFLAVLASLVVMALAGVILVLHCNLLNLTSLVTKDTHSSVNVN